MKLYDVNEYDKTLGVKVEIYVVVIKEAFSRCRPRFRSADVGQKARSTAKDGTGGGQEIKVDVEVERLSNTTTDCCSGGNAHQLIS